MHRQIMKTQKTKKLDSLSRMEVEEVSHLDNKSLSTANEHRANKIGSLLIRAYRDGKMLSIYKFLLYESSDFHKVIHFQRE